MKPYAKQILPSLATLLAVLCGCSHEQAEPCGIVRTIELMAASPDGTLTVEGSRGSGPTNSWRDTQISLLYGTTTKQYEEAWSASVSVFGNVNIANSPAYPPNNTPVFIAAYYPVSGKLQVDKKTVIYTSLDGSDDIMIAPEESASALTPFDENSRLKFSHMFTQLVFRLSSPPGELFPNSTKVKSITVRSDAQPFYTTATVDLVEQTMLLSDKTDSFTAFTGNYTITTTPTDMATVLLPASTVGYSVNVVIVISDGVTDETFYLDPISAEFHNGTAYAVTLLFSGTAFVPSSPKITTWTAVNLGSEHAFE